MKRSSSHARGYGARWRLIRVAVLSTRPACTMCPARATEVDHIDGNNRNNKRANLRPMCKPCHILHHSGTEPVFKIGCDVRGYPLSPNNYWR